MDDHAFDEIDQNSDLQKSLQEKIHSLEAELEKACSSDLTCHEKKTCMPSAFLIISECV